MVISFSPAIEETVQVAVPEWHTTSSTVEVRFSAVLGDDELRRFRQDGMKVQLWSNIPAGRGDGEWSEMDFHEVESSLGFSSVGSSPPQVSLVPLDYIEEKPNGLLSVNCSVPFSGQSQHFFFTYRLVYSSGEIAWLGHFHRNGTLIIDVENENVVLEEGWVKDSSQLNWTGSGNEGEDVPIAQLVRLEDWSFWSGRKDSFLTGPAPASNATLVFLVPRLQPKAIYRPKTLVLSASPGTVISVSTSGKISASGPGSLLLQTLDPADPFIDRVIAHNPSLNYQPLGVFSNHVAFVSAAKASSIIQTVVIPFAGHSGFSSQIAVPSASLGSTLGAPTLEYTIFAAAQPSVQFVDPVLSESGLVNFVFPPFGGVFILSPLYLIPAIPTNEDTSVSEKFIGVTVLSPHSIIEDDPTTHDGTLPTPPPSPHLQPIAHLTSPSQFDSSNTSISELGDQDELPTLSDPLNLDSSSLLPPAEYPRAPASSMTRWSSASLVGPYRENGPNVVAFTKYLYLALALWFSMSIQKLFGGGAPPGKQDTEQSPPKSPQSETTGGEGADSASPTVNERTPLLSHVSPPAVVSEPRVQEPPSQIPLVHTAAVPPTRTFLPSLKFDLLEEKSDSHALILRDTGGIFTEGNLSQKIIVEINNQTMSLNNVKLLQEGVFYINLGWKEPGQMIIKLIKDVL